MMRRPYLGAGPTVTPDMVGSLGLGDGRLVVVSVIPRPAAHIEAFNGMSLFRSRSAGRRSNASTTASPPGDRQNGAARRHARKSGTRLSCRELPGRRATLVVRARSPLAGAKVANLSPALADELRMDPSVEGVVIVDVPGNSPAAVSGFQRGDILVSVNNEQINKTRDLDRVTQGSGRVWRFVLLRGGQR
jgi:hypothetical protein